MNLDLEREASMADEGGASGAAVESQETDEGADGREDLDGSRLAELIVVGSAFVLGALAALTFTAIWRGGE